MSIFEEIGVEEWLVKVVQSVHGNAKSRVRVNWTCNPGRITPELKVGG